jgi:hypothetical protein
MDVRPPKAEELRALLQAQGVEATDADLEGVLGFLRTILPQLAELEASLPPDTVPA